MTQHPQAEILRAIADGKLIEDKTSTGYTHAPADYALRVLSKGGGRFLRIKPATIMLNGVELPKPLDAAGITQTSNRIRLITDDRQENFWFNTREDRDAVYAKLVEILS